MIVIHAGIGDEVNAFKWTELKLDYLTTIPRMNVYVIANESCVCHFQGPKFTCVTSMWEGVRTV
jgi:hypothetical protein